MCMYVYVCVNECMCNMYVSIYLYVYVCMYICENSVNPQKYIRSSRTPNCDPLLLHINSNLHPRLQSLLLPLPTVLTRHSSHHRTDEVTEIKQKIRRNVGC